MTTYADFLARKTQEHADGGFSPSWLPDFLFPFQTALVEWATRKGRAAVFADCGLGKTAVELVWAANVHRQTGRPVLIVCPLAVSFQTVGEAEKFGVDAQVSRDGTVAAPITVTNYERLHLFDRQAFAGVVCDESSAIKAFDGQRRALVTDFLRKMPYRLLATATAAPNDYIELGTSSEALGHLGHMDMLTRFFTNNQRTSSATRHHWDAPTWRFKGHAEEPFWRWVASWARACRRPSDLGFDDGPFVLPELAYRHHVLDVGVDEAEGALFATPVSGLREERAESRRSITARCESAAAALADAQAAVAWCYLNDEGDLLSQLIPGAVQVSGADPVEAKEERLLAFSRGEFPVLVSKPTVAGWGLNWQHCHRMTFFPSHSYEQFYQAVRRCWRFGQQQPVTVDVITTKAGEKALASLERKADQAARMFDRLVLHMRDAISIDRSRDAALPVEVPAWAAS